jgi:uncharacterized protein (TIGR03437 family)
MLRRQLISAMQITLMSAVGLATASAQTQDNSGNAMLKGAFYFRHVAIQIVNANDDPTDITAVNGTITFDGAGKYTLKGTSVDNGVAGGAPQALTQSGTYAIGSNGLGYLTNELYPNDPNAAIYGAIAQGVFSGSSSESQQDMNTLNDLFVAIPAPAVAPANAGFTAAYQTGVLDFPGANSSAVKNALFNLTPDGKGNFGTITLTGQAANMQAGNGAALTQTVSGATYNFNSDGSATLTIPLPSGVSVAASAMFTGTKTLYTSADGNYILGFTATGFDIFFGVKALAAGAGNNMLTQGLYFNAGLEDAPGFFGAASFYGGTFSTGNANGDGIVHQRLNVPGFLSEDYGSDNQIILNADGTSSGSDFNFFQYAFGAGGQAFVGIGTAGQYALTVGTHAPTFNATGSVFLNPIGVLNAATFQPITASLAPGEVIALFGSGLSSTSMNIQGGQAFPTTLGGVQVTIDGIACPLYSVSSTQVAAVVPFELATNQTGLANIQVINNNVKSNVVQMYLTDAAPGSFSQTQNGLGLAAALHASNNQLITPANPAKGGEFISLYLTGLGTVTPTVADGAVGPSSPLSYSDLFNSGNLAVYFNDYGVQGTVGNQGKIQFAGLVPTLAGLYQINVQVPTSGLAAGDNVYVEFVTDAADVNQIQIPFGLGSSSDRPAAARLTPRQRMQTIRSHPQSRTKHKPRPAALQAQ